MSKFKVGDEVVCIDDLGQEHRISNGKRYFIKRFNEHDPDYGMIDGCGYEFRLSRFEPVCHCDDYLSGYLDAMIESSMACPERFINEHMMALMDDNTYERTCMANLIHGVV